MSRTVFGLTSVALLLTLWVSPAQTADKKKKNAVPEGTVIGTIKSIGEDGKVITIEAPTKKKKKTATTTDVKITKDTKIEYNGIDNKDEQKLQVGYAVNVQLNEKDKDTAAAIKVSKALEAPKKKKKNQP